MQGFPDTYKLLENDNAVYKQMGNAVSVPVIEALISDLIENNEAIIGKIKRRTGHNFVCDDKLPSSACT